MIKVRRLIKKFLDGDREVLVLNGIDFEVKKGEFVSILGPVGCGKTTLLEIVAGLEKPTEGEVIIDNFTHIDIKIHMIFQGTPLFYWKTAKENIMLPLRYDNKYSKERVEQICNECLKLVGLEKFSNFYPKQLSGGMRQKVAFAGILALRPQILLLDEPFSMLDAQARIKTQMELLKIQQEIKATVLFVTHNIEEAIFLSDKIVVLSKAPSEVLKTIEIDFPHPRNDIIITHAKFNKIKREIMFLLNKENK
jgi:NitT/TauT family transport system ATP-binding protein